MEIEIISKEFIKPSSPTLHHLRTHKISFLDQLQPSIHVPVVLYYVADTSLSIEKRLQSLKKSLSQTLTRFYPFAGKIKDALSIDCDDEGAYYIEAQIKTNLSEFLNQSKQPDLSLIRHFLPCDDATLKEASVGTKVAMVQVSVFNCGGIAIGIYVSHMVADGISLSTFLKDWGDATSRGVRGVCCDTLHPDFSAAPTRFPQNDCFSNKSLMMTIIKRGRTCTRRFVFDASALAKLKCLIASDVCAQQIPTRVEVISALLWKCFMKTKPCSIQKPCIVTHPVNLRPKQVPPLSNYLMGNLLGVAFAQSTVETELLGNLVLKLREAIGKVNGEYLRNIEGEHGYYNFYEGVKEMEKALCNKGRGEYLAFSSWCQFGLYEVDFGWGRPIWVTTILGSHDGETRVFMNYVCLIETKGGDDIEAWVTLEQEDMNILECDQELLSFASLNPSPLFIGD